MPRTTRTLLLALALAPLTKDAAAQELLYDWPGGGGKYWFGISVDAAGDVNGDGRGDLIVGAFGDNVNGWDSGSASVFSGADGALLYKFTGDATGDKLGMVVSGAGDVNGDGFDDLMAGSPFMELHAGVVRVLSGRDGSLLHEFEGAAAFDSLGSSIDGAGDVDGDGFDDVIVGAENTDLVALGAGSAYVFSGRTGALLHQFDGTNAADRLGAAVAGAGDVDADGLADLIVGAPFFGTKNRGRARVYSGATGKVLHSFKGAANHERLGQHVDGAGDVDADGFADLIVSGTGFARVFSGLDGSQLYEVEVLEQGYGAPVSGAGDVNGDGYDDFLTGHGFTVLGFGRITVFSGKDGSRLFMILSDDELEYFGTAAAGAGDVDGDGLPDIIGGAYYSNANHTNSGAARVFSGCSQVGSAYCGPAVVNSTGSPASIGACGSIVAETNYLMLTARDLPPGQPVLLLASETQGFTQNPGGSQGHLCLGGDIARFAQQVHVSGEDGRTTLQVDLSAVPATPVHAVVAGETWSFQAWYRDAPASNFTDGVALTFE